MTALNTRESLIEATEQLIRAKGFSAFSYADLEREIGIRKASIHYHFPTKEGLGICVVETYLIRLKAQLESIDRSSSSPSSRLKSFADLFTEYRSAGQLPLCGALASEMTLLPEPMQELTTAYLETQMHWLEGTIRDGIAGGEIPRTDDTRQKAFEILSLLEGASFVSWGLQNQEDLDRTIISRVLGKCL